MANIGDLFVRLRADTSNFEQGMSQAQATSGTFRAVISQNLSQIGQQMSQTGQQILSTMGNLVNTAAEWTASIEQQKFVYNNLDSAIQKSITNNTGLATSLGMTEQQYLNNSTAVADFLARTGMTSESIAEQSGKITELTADMAAYADVDVTTATSDFKSALMGNFETMDKYGVSLSVAVINQGEYAKSLGKSWDQMTQAEKAQAILSETFESSSSITGLAKQESDSYNGSMKMLKQQIVETATAIGSQLFPVLQPLVKSISEIAQKIANWATEHPKLTQGILLVVGVIGILLAIGGPLLTLFSSLSIMALALNMNMLPLIGIIAGVTAVIVALVAIGVLLWQNWDTIKAKAGEIWNSVTKAVGDAMQGIGDWFNSCVESATQWASDLWNKATEAGTNFLNSITTFFSQLPGKVWSFLQMCINKAQNWATQMKQKAKEAATTFISNVANTISQLPGKVWGYLSSTIAKAVQFVTSFANKGRQAATEFGTKISSGLSSIPGKMATAGKNIVQGLWNGISGAAGWLYNKVTNFAGGIVGKIQGALKIKSPSRVMADMVGRYIPQGIAVGIDANADSVYDSLNDLSNTAVGLSTDTFKGVVASSDNSSNNSSSLNNNTNDNAIVEELRSLRKLVESLELILNVDAREFVRTAVAPNKKEIDNYDSRKVKFAY